jgi:hypothetical protein
LKLVSLSPDYVAVDEHLPCKLIQLDLLLFWRFVIIGFFFKRLAETSILKLVSWLLPNLHAHIELAVPLKPLLR